MTSRTILYRSFRRDRTLAQKLRWMTIMEATQNYPNLLSEKQAAKRLGIARITLLRAREAGRIRFFRIGTRVLYCAEHLTEFLNNCERNRRRSQANERERVSEAPRKKNVSSGRVRVTGVARSRADSKKKAQASLPFAASR
jgi:excisionase family DNA binding protein